MPRYEIVPIGWVESPLTDRAQAPRQGDEGAPPAWIVFEPAVAEGIRDLEPGTEVLVLNSAGPGERPPGTPPGADGAWPASRQAPSRVLDQAARDELVTRPRDDPANPLDKTAER